jgi:hypothetical protein
VRRRALFEAFDPAHTVPNRGVARTPTAACCWCCLFERTGPIRPGPTWTGCNPPTAGFSAWDSSERSQRRTLKKIWGQNGTSGAAARDKEDGDDDEEEDAPNEMLGLVVLGDAPEPQELHLPVRGSAGIAIRPRGSERRLGPAASPPKLFDWKECAVIAPESKANCARR